MKPHIVLKRFSLPLCLVLIASALLYSAFLLPERGNARLSWKAPFRSMDLLPLLPRKAALPLLVSLRSAVDLLPTFVGAASASEGHLEWKGACFYNNTPWVEFHNSSRSRFGGGTLHFKVKNNGVSIFLMQSGMVGTLRALWDVFPLFTNTGWGESSNLAFHKKHMGATFEERPQPWISNISIDDVHSGDLLAISKIRGRWGGFETLEKWVTGSYAGHSAVFLKDSEGSLWVAESGHGNEKGEAVIAILPWDKWWELELTKDESNAHIALLPLHPDMRAKFNTTAAREYAENMLNKPYGYHDMIFSWIDTITGNYPPPLDAHLVASAMTVWSRIEPSSAANLWNEALNKRLGTQGLDISEIIVEAEKNGRSFDKLLTIPEQDDWLYTDGKSTSCVAFILELYKAAGLFGRIANSIQVTEFTVSETSWSNNPFVFVTFSTSKTPTPSNLFESNLSRLSDWCNKEDGVKLPFCQIKGRYRMELPGYNSMEPYPHMNEKCPSLPPKYVRTEYC